MSKIDNMLTLINLLLSRRVLTSSEISRACGVSRRTAYRYINSISEAGFPVYFDEIRQSYRLVDDYDIKMPALGTDEIIIVLSALINLQEHVNENYRSEIDRIIIKIMSKQVLPFEKMVSMLKNIMASQEENGDRSRALNMIKSMAALLLGKKLKLCLTDGDGQTTHKLLENPRLEFGRTWQLSDKNKEILSEMSIDKLITAKIFD